MPRYTGKPPSLRVCVWRTSAKRQYADGCLFRTRLRAAEPAALVPLLSLAQLARFLAPNEARPQPQVACAVRSAERRLSSCLFDKEVLRTRGLKRSNSGRTLSGVDLLISMNRADEPFGMVLPRSLMNWSLMPKSASDPDSAPTPMPVNPPIAMPASGFRSNSPVSAPTSMPALAPRVAPNAVRFKACLI